MAITAPTKTTDFSGFLTPDESAPIFDDATKSSVVQQLVRQVPLGINGQKIPVVTNKPTANWVGEASAKPTTSLGLGLKYIEPKKLAAIAVTSSEVVRANPGNYSQLLRTTLAEAFAVAFDYAALYNLGGDGTGTGPFDSYIAQTSKSASLGTDTDTYLGVVAGLKTLVDDQKKLTGFAFDRVAEPVFLGSLDGAGRPLFVDAPAIETASVITPGRLIGRPAMLGDNIYKAAVAEDGDTPAQPAILGYGGDWSKAAWGVVGGISFRVSTEATVTVNGELTSLWENNLVAVLAEAEYGFVVADTDAFVKYTEAAA